MRGLVFAGGRRFCGVVAVDSGFDVIRRAAQKLDMGIEQFFELFAFVGIRKGDATQHNRVAVVVDGDDLVIAGGLGADESNQLGTEVEM